MNQPQNLKSQFRRYLGGVALLLAVAAVGGLANHDLRVERGQAHSLVADGQSQIQRGERAAAVLSLERARLLAPRADFVRASLASAHVQPLESPFERAVNWLAPKEWAFLLVTCGWVAGLSTAVLIAQNFKRSFSRRLALGATGLFLLSAVGVVQSSVTTGRLAVVTSATGVLVAPYEGAGATADLSPGMVVVVDARYHDFVQVHTPGGAQGWVAKSVVESVVGT